MAWELNVNSPSKDNNILFAGSHKAYHKAEK
jgi:hypothetical protein